MNRDDIDYWLGNTQVRDRANQLRTAVAALSDVAGSTGLTQGEVLAVLYVLRDKADWRQFAEQEKRCFLDAITELEPEETPELCGFRTLEPAALDSEIQR